MSDDDPRATLAETLLKVGIAARTDGALEDRLSSICRAMTEILGCDRSSVFVLEGEQIVPVANHGNPPDIAAAFPHARFRANHPLFRAAMSSSEPVHIADAEAAPDLLRSELVDAVRLRSLIAAGLTSGSSELGVITAEFNETNSSFRSFDTVVVQGLAQIASLMIDEHATREREQELLDEIRWRSEHDEVTGLPNRRALSAWFADARASEDGEQAIAVLLADLDRFKVVNDALGHAAGDRLLVSVADRFVKSFEELEALVTRFGGDEFVVAAFVRDQAHAQELAETIADALREPFVLPADHSLIVTASVGIALTTASRLDPDRVLSDADAAMYVAKDMRLGRSVLAQSDQRPVVSHRFTLEVSLARALEARNIEPWYQPIVDVRTGRCVAVEALARWEHPERGVLVPHAFLSSVMEMGLLRRLTDCVAAQAAEHLEAVALADISLFLNLGVSDIDDDLATRLATLLPDARRVVVELTEREALQPAVDVAAVLEEVRRTGVRVALDDFGTGFSSLSMLAELPLDIVKIDRSLIQGVRDVRALETLRATVRLGAALGLTVLAEGVEQQHEYREVIDAEVDLAQGFLIARPMSYPALLDAFERGELRS